MKPRERQKNSHTHTHGLILVAQSTSLTVCAVLFHQHICMYVVCECVSEWQARQAKQTNSALISSCDFSRANYKARATQFLRIDLFPPHHLFVIVSQAVTCSSSSGGIQTQTTHRCKSGSVSAYTAYIYLYHIIIWRKPWRNSNDVSRSCSLHSMVVVVMIGAVAVEVNVELVARVRYLYT